MENKNIVFIAKSLDGFIAGPNEDLDWLQTIPNPENIDMGFGALMEEIDAIVMGRTTFEVVCGFGGEWPYTKPVVVLSNSIKEIPANYRNHAFLKKGDVSKILNELHQGGFKKLYIDGGKTIQNFLKEDLIDDLRITTIPIMLGGGFALFDVLPKYLKFDHVKTEVFLGQLVQSQYVRSK